MKKYLFILALCAIVPAQAMFRQIKNAPKFLGMMQMQQRHHGSFKWIKKDEPKKDFVAVPSAFFKMWVRSNKDQNFAILDYLQDTSEQNLHFLKEYISCLTDINKRDKYDSTLLMYVAAKGNFEIVDFLLQRKDIDVNAQDECGRTAMMWAAWNGHMSIVERFLDEPDISIATMSISGDAFYYLRMNLRVKITPKIRQKLLDRGVVEWRLENL